MRVRTGLAAVAAAGLVYGRIFRPWHLHWGATPEEAACRWPAMS